MSVRSGGVMEESSIFPRQMSHLEMQIDHFASNFDETPGNLESTFRLIFLIFCWSKTSWERNHVASEKV
jgi:hypothetical protein